MKRRDFLKTAAAAGAASVLSAPAVVTSAKAQARQETLLVVTEYGPNNFDIHGVGANRPGYEVSWNCYDRLMTYGEEDAARRHAVLRSRQVRARAGRRTGTSADTSVTFKLRKDAKFHDGTPITAKDVKWSFDRAVTVGGFPTFQMKAGSLEKPEQFVAVDDSTFRVDFIRKDKLTMPDLAVIVPARLPLRAGQEERHREGPLGHGVHQDQHRRRRRLQGDALAGRQGGRLRAQRRLEERAAAQGQARHLAHGAVGRQPARAARARRRRHLLRPAEQGFRRAASRPARSPSSARRSGTAWATSA